MVSTPDSDDRRLSVRCSILDRQTDAVENRWYRSAVRAVEGAIAALSANGTLTVVVLIGEEDATQTISARGAALTRKLDQPGLFLGLAVQDIVRDKLGLDVRFEDFGVVYADDGTRAERLFSLIHPDLPAPELAQRKVAGNCPRLHKSFVGRNMEVDEIQDMILQRMLVTVIGPPGVGKTTTVINVARSFVDEYDGGVWWFSVEQRSSLDELLQAIANEKGLISLHGALDLDRVAEALAAKQAVIVFDGCERLTKEIGLLCSAILAKTTTLTMVLTSTRPIETEGEFIFRLDPMSLPAQVGSGEDALFSSDALKLFYARAAQAGVQLGLDEVTVGIVASICKGVDCLPVAIELLAASLRTSSLDLICKRLANNQLKSLDQGISAEKGLSLSYSTLSDVQRTLLVRLAMFQGEWSIDLAAELWADVLSAETIGALHQSLVDCSWIAYRPDRNLFRMLLPLKAFCRNQAGERLKAITRRFCDEMCKLASRVTAGLAGATALESEVTLARHYSDFANCLEMAMQSPELSDCAAAMMAQIVHFWRRTDFLHDAERLSHAFLANGVQGIDRARALQMLGIVSFRRRRLSQAVDQISQCLALCREQGNKAAEALSLCNLGMTLMAQGDFNQARKCYFDATEVFRERGHAVWLCGALCNLADVEIRFARAGGASKDRTKLLAEAARHLAEALANSAEADPLILQAIWHNFGALALEHSQFEEAEIHLFRALSVCERHSLLLEAEEATSYLAEIHLKKGLGPSAAKMLGLSLSIQKASGKDPSEPELERLGALTHAVIAEVGEERAERLMKYGEKLNLAEILPDARNRP